MAAPSYNYGITQLALFTLAPAAISGTVPGITANNNGLSNGPRVRQTTFAVNTRYGGSFPLSTTISTGNYVAICLSNGNNAADNARVASAAADQGAFLALLGTGPSYVEYAVSSGDASPALFPVTAVSGASVEYPCVIERGSTPRASSGSFNWSITSLEVFFTSTGGNTHVGVMGAYSLATPTVSNGDSGDPVTFAKIATAFRTNALIPRLFERSAGNYAGLGNVFISFLGVTFNNAYIRESVSSLVLHPTAQVGIPNRQLHILNPRVIGFSGTSDTDFFRCNFFGDADDSPRYDVEVLAGTHNWNEHTIWNAREVTLDVGTYPGLICDGCGTLNVNETTIATLTDAVFRNAPDGDGLIFTGAPGDYAGVTLRFNNNSSTADLTINPSSAGEFDFTGLTVASGYTLKLKNASATHAITIVLASGITTSIVDAGAGLTVQTPVPTTTFSGFPTTNNANGVAPAPVIGFYSSASSAGFIAGLDTADPEYSAGSFTVLLSDYPGVTHVVGDAIGWIRTDYIPVDASNPPSSVSLAAAFREIVSETGVALVGNGTIDGKAKLTYDQANTRFEVAAGPITFADVLDKKEELTSNVAGLENFETAVVRGIQFISSKYGNEILLPSPLTIAAAANAATSPILENFLVVRSGNPTADPFEHGLASTAPGLTDRPEIRMISTLFVGADSGGSGGTAPTEADIYSYFTAGTRADAFKADIGTGGANLTAIPWNADWDAEVRSEVVDGLGQYTAPTLAQFEARTILATNYSTLTPQSVANAMLLNPLGGAQPSSVWNLALLASANTVDLSNRLTAARAGYLDKLNVSGTLAHTDNAATFRATGFATPGNVADAQTAIIAALPTPLDATDTAAAVTDALTAYTVPTVAQVNAAGFTTTRHNALIATEGYTRPMAKQLGLVTGIAATHAEAGITVSDGDGSTTITDNGDGSYTVEGA